MQGTALRPQTETKVGKNLYKDEYGRLYERISGAKVMLSINQIKGK